MRSSLLLLLISVYFFSAFSLFRSSLFLSRKTSLPRNSRYSQLLSSNNNNNIINSQFNAKDLLISDCKGLTRNEINEFVLQLEKKNPTSEPAFSTMLNGVWEVLSSGIASVGMLGFQAIKAFPGDFVDASDVTITICSTSPRVKAESFMKIGFSKIAVSIVSDIVAKSGVRLSESYERGKIGSLSIPLTNNNLFTRDLLVTYLDEDLLIARDSLGTPEILRRKDYVSIRAESDSSSQTETPSA